MFSVYVFSSWTTQTHTYSEMGQKSGCPNSIPLPCLTGHMVSDAIMDSPPSQSHSPWEDKEPFLPQKGTRLVKFPTLFFPLYTQYCLCSKCSLWQEPTFLSGWVKVFHLALYSWCLVNYLRWVFNIGAGWLEAMLLAECLGEGTLEIPRLPCEKSLCILRAEVKAL